MEIKFPYGKEELTGQIPEERNAGILYSSLECYQPEGTQAELIQRAMAHPIGSEKLSQLARGKQKVVLIASDHTRPVPSKWIVPCMLREIREGNPLADITILIATGCHRTTTQEELRQKFGDTIFDREKIVVHDCDDEANLISIGTLPSDGRLTVNRLAAQADLLVAEGFIEPHFFAGFSGGRKSVLPGIASRKTVMYNHNAAFIASEHARTGILEENPIHADMVSAARQAGLAYIVNVVLNSQKEIVYAVAGDALKAHEAGCDFLRSRCGVQAKQADIVITTNGGYPLDQNIYQAVKGMTAAEAAVHEGGVIIMLARSNDGHGGKSFYETFREERDEGKLMERFLSTKPEDTIVDQWQSQIFARVLQHARVIYISEVPDQMVLDLHMIPAHSIEEALHIADGILKKSKGPDYTGTILSIPDGVSVIVQ